MHVIGLVDQGKLPKGIKRSDGLRRYAMGAEKCSVSRNTARRSVEKVQYGGFSIHGKPVGHQFVERPK
jgi:hypothetical protein